MDGFRAVVDVMNIVIRLLLIFLCLVAIFFGLAIYDLKGGFLHHALSSALLYAGIIWLHKLGHGWKP
jgi:hypothetical protein